MALNWSMPSAPPFISSDTVHCPLRVELGVGVGDDLTGGLRRAELVHGHDLAVVVELGEHHGGLGQVLVPGRELERGAGSPATVVVVVSPAPSWWSRAARWSWWSSPSWNGVAASALALDRGGRGRGRRPPWSWWSSPAAVVVVEPSAAVVVVVASRTSGGSWSEHGPEPQLGRGAHQIEGALLLVDPGQLHDDRVALAGDLGLGHAEGVDAVADDLDGLVEGLVAGLLGGLEHHRDAALEVEARAGATCP